MASLRWYSINGTLPGMGTRVLVANVGWVGVAQRIDRRKRDTSWINDGGHTVIGVTHWAWLPDAPARKRRASADRGGAS